MSKKLVMLALVAIMTLTTVAPVAAADNSAAGQITTVETATANKTTTALKLAKFSELDVRAKDFNSGLVYGSFRADKGSDLKEKTALYAINCPEEANYRINYTISGKGEQNLFKNNNKVRMVLYTNASHTKTIGEKVELACTRDKVAEKDVCIWLTKGTYYLEVSAEVEVPTKAVDMNYAVAFGYLPSSAKTILVDRTYDKVKKTVTIDVTGLDKKTLLIKEGDYTSATMLEKNNWLMTTELKDGKYTVTEKTGKDKIYTLRMEDKYGNVYGELVKFPEYSAPAAPAIKKYKSGTKLVSGTAAAGLDVTVTVGSNKYTTRSDTKGNWSVKTGALKVGTEITAKTATVLGYESTTVTKVAVKNQKIATPKVKALKKNAKTVKGEAKAGTKVYVKIGKKTYTANVSSKGKFSVKVSKLKKGTKVKVYVKDKYNNYSSTKTVTVK